MSLLQVQNLSTFFQDGPKIVKAVQGVSFSLEEGKTLGLVGESGSGKSVSALSITKLLPYPKAFHPSGKILYKGQNLLGMSEAEIRKIRGSEIAMIFQEPMTSLNPLHTIEKQISEVLEIHQICPEKDFKKRIIKLLQMVGFPDGEHRLNAYPHQLSGGQRQRVMIAMALAGEPKILIADEPTTALDVTTQLQIMKLLKKLQKDLGLSVLLITHDLNLVRHMTDDICIMRHGKVVEAGKTVEIFKQPKHAYTKELISSEPDTKPAPILKDAQPILSAKHLEIKFPIKKGLFQKVQGYVHAVNNAHFSLDQGQTLGIVGESGSGKTTMALALLRLIQSSGDISFDGTLLNKLTSRELIPFRKEIQIVFQDPYGSLSPRMTVQEIIAEGLYVHEKELSDAIIDARVVRAMQDVRLDPETRGRYPHEFSGGQRQRIALARALIMKPKVLILDEPTSALDRAVQKDLVTLLHDLQKSLKLSYVLISHDLRIIRALAHNIIVMRHGDIVEQNSNEGLFQNPQNPYTKTLMQAAFS